jgi:cell division protease FtsH
MSRALSPSATSLPLCKAQDISKDIHPKIPLRGDVQISSRNTGLSRRNILNITGVGLISAGTLPAQPARAEPEALNESVSNRMSYSRFLEYLNEDAVKRVDLFENGLVAIAEIDNPVLNKIQRVKVQLPGLQPDLVRKLKEKDVDFAAHPVEPNYGLMFLDFVTNFGFPLLFFGTLLLRSSLNNTPGGPNLPFGLERYVIKLH